MRQPGAALAIAALTVACSDGKAPLPPTPACLETLVAGCALQPACSFSRNAAGAADRFCFASGLVLERAQITACGGDPTSGTATTVETIRNTDGSICYTRESSCSCNMACAHSNLTWRNAAAEVVAVEEVGGGTHSITCAGAGADAGAGAGRVACDENTMRDCAAWPRIPAGPTAADSCTEGSCPAP
jgi:hypothetical protein